MLSIVPLCIASLGGLEAYICYITVFGLTTVLCTWHLLVIQPYTSCIMPKNTSLLNKCAINCHIFG